MKYIQDSLARIGVPYTEVYVGGFLRIEVGGPDILIYLNVGLQDTAGTGEIGYQTFKPACRTKVLHAFRGGLSEAETLFVDLAKASRNLLIAYKFSPEKGKILATLEGLMSA